jgi:serine/threonine protein kinase
MTTLLKNRYRIMSIIGDGGFGQTYLAEDIDRFNHLCVIKRLKPVIDDPQTYEVIKEHFEREAAILLELGKLPNVRIPKLQAYFSEGKEFYLVQDLIEGHNLAETVDHEGPLTALDTERIISDLLPTLDRVHALGIIHRDIKPENVMISDADRRPFLIDFGAVKEVVATKLNSRGVPVSSVIIGSPGFIPYEQVDGRPVVASDLYSLGLTAVYLLTGKRPNELKNAAGEIDWMPHAPDLPPAMKVTISKSIEHHASARFQTARDMFDSLKADARKNSYTRRVPRSAGIESGLDVSAALPGPSGSDGHRVAPENHSKPSMPATAKPTRKAAYKRFLIATLILLALIGTAFSAIKYKSRVERELALAESNLKKEVEARKQAEAERDLALAQSADESMKRIATEDKLGRLEQALPRIDIDVTEVKQAIQSDTSGVFVHVTFRAHNLRDVNCKVTASLFDAEGKPLMDENGVALKSPWPFTPRFEEEKIVAHLFFSDNELYRNGYPAKVKVRISKKNSNDKDESLGDDEKDFY